MTKPLSLFGLAAVAALLLAAPQACYYENEETLYPVDSTACNTTGITYGNTIQALVTANCSGSDCHGPAPNTSGFAFDTYEALRDYALGPNSNLIARINDAGNPMPKGGPLLPECDRAQIAAWVNAGAPQ